MTRVPLLPFAVAALLAATAGCASFAPAPKAVEPAAAAPATDAAAPRAESPAVAPEPPAPPPIAAPAAPEAPKSASRASSRSRTGDAASAARGAPSAEGPTVTTFVYSDAPVAVRREARTAEASAGPPAKVPEGFNPYRIAYAPGAYRCEFGRSVQVRSVSADLRTTVLRWGRDEFTLRAVEARSGALRYEDPGSGLAWIVLRDRSMLLDMREGQRLANACRA